MCLRLEGGGGQEARDAGHAHRGRGGGRAGRADGVDGGEDGLEGLRGGAGHVGADVDVDAEDGELGVRGLEDEVHLHGHAGAVVEVLAGQVEVELGELERVVVAGNGQVAARADDLDRGAQVLEGRAGREVGDEHRVFGALALGVGARDHVDGRLVRAQGTGGVGGHVEGVPSRRTLTKLNQHRTTSPREATPLDATRTIAPLYPKVLIGTAPPSALGAKWVP